VNRGKRKEKKIRTSHRKASSPGENKGRREKAKKERGQKFGRKKEGSTGGEKRVHIRAKKKSVTSMEGKHEQRKKVKKSVMPGRGVTKKKEGKREKGGFIEGKKHWGEGVNEGKKDRRGGCKVLKRKE